MDALALGQSLPRLRGFSGSPSTRVIRPFSRNTRIPHPTWQNPHVLFKIFPMMAPQAFLTLSTG
jgi:hypothetical protein